MHGKLVYHGVVIGYMYESHDLLLVRSGQYWRLRVHGRVPDVEHVRQSHQNMQTNTAFKACDVLLK
jgi:hypothetical protein